MQKDVTTHLQQPVKTARTGCLMQQQQHAATQLNRCCVAVVPSPSAPFLNHKKQQAAHDAAAAHRTLPDSLLEYTGGDRDSTSTYKEECHHGHNHARRHPQHKTVGADAPSGGAVACWAGDGVQPACLNRVRGKVAKTTPDLPVTAGQACRQCMHTTEHKPNTGSEETHTQRFGHTKARVVSPPQCLVAPLQTRHPCACIPSLFPQTHESTTTATVCCPLSHEVVNSYICVPVGRTRSEGCTFRSIHALLHPPTN